MKIIAAIKRMAAATALPTLTASQAIAQDMMPGGYWNGGWGYGHMMTGGIMMIAFWGGLIVLVVLLVRWLASESTTGGRGRDHGRSDALDILRERFARGEIDEAEYHARRKTLEGDSR